MPLRVSAPGCGPISGIDFVADDVRAVAEEHFWRVGLRGDGPSKVSPVTVTAEKPQPRPFWRSSVPSHALLPPDVVSDSAHTICWTGVVSPVVCTSGAKLCW